MTHTAYWYPDSLPCPGAQRWHPGRLVDQQPVISSASFPPDLASWNQDEHPYYLEVFGESEPAIDMTHAEVVPAGGSNAAMTNATPIYEYWWTIGHGGSKPEHRHLLGVERRSICRIGSKPSRRASTLFPDLGRLARTRTGGERKVPESGSAAIGLDKQGGAGLAAHAADPRRCWTSRLGTRRGAGVGTAAAGAAADPVSDREAAGGNRPSGRQGIRLVR